MRNGDSTPLTWPSGGSSGMLAAASRDGADNRSKRDIHPPQKENEMKVKAQVKAGSVSWN